MTDGASALRAARSQASVASAQAAVAEAAPEVTTPDAPADVVVTEELLVQEGELIDLVRAPPANVALLHVYEHELPTAPDTAYSVLATHSVAALPGAPARGRPRHALADLAQGANQDLSLPPSEIFAAMNEWSMQNRDVAGWLAKLRAKVKDLHLIIVDHTGYELPWEMLTLPPATREGTSTYLGLAVPTARWQVVQDNVTFEDVVLDSDVAEHAGCILAFVDSELEGGGPERQVLQQIGAQLEGCLCDLRDCLKAPREDVGLVYVATHGHYAEDVVNSSIGSAENDRLKLAVVRTERLQTFEKSDAIVFLNVCHAGRLFNESKYLHSKRLLGFPEMFLGHLAKGVIATTGWVDDEYAGEAGEWVLNRLQAGPQATMSEVLREWREHVAESLPDAPTERQRLQLLTAFMYVYYGNPQVRLALA